MEGTTLFDSQPDSLPAHLAGRSRSRRPLVSGAAVGIVGYVFMTVLLVGLGLLLTKMLLDGAVGSWDRGLDRWFFDQRTPTFDELTVWGSRLGDTLGCWMSRQPSWNSASGSRPWPTPSVAITCGFTRTTPS